MILDTLLWGTENTGYIAGDEDGIVTAGGESAGRDIYLLDVKTFEPLYVTASLDNGHYLFTGLDPNCEYLVIARDHNRQLEPAAYDYVKPANDLTIAEQRELWESWQ